MSEPIAVLEPRTNAASIAAGHVCPPSGLRQFRLLVAHLLDRFVNNETLSVSGETLPFVMTVAGAVAVPTLIASIFVFPEYHAFPPRPPLPNFWTQVCEHYFFMVYGMVAMGLITVFEADLFFPETLDTLILSPLPIPRGRLALARVCANLIFLVLLLLGTNLFTVIAYPPITELHVGRLFLANLSAVLAGAVFAAAACVALQGLLSCVVPTGRYAQATALLQCGTTAALISTFLTMPKLFPLLERVTADPRANWFPPFWFLGLYESILGGLARLPRFAPLAHTAVWATGIAILAAMVCFPLAYRRRSRQAIEGAGTMNLESAASRWGAWVLHRTVLRSPQQRAVYHFLSQSLRTPKHRVYLAMYSGLGLGLIVSGVLRVTLDAGAVRFAADSRAIAAMMPGVAFWTVAGLCFVLASSVDPRGGWVFPVTSGLPSAAQLDAVRMWVTLWTVVISGGVIAVAAALFPAELHGAALLAQILIAVALSVLLPDLFLFDARVIPFTSLRIPMNTDLAWMLLRYIVFLPVTVFAAIRLEAWAEHSAVHLAAIALAVLLLHSSIREASHRALQLRASRSDVDHLTGMLPGLGLAGELE